MRGLLVLAMVAAQLLAAAPARAATYQVVVEDNAFGPKTLQIDPGDTVEWTAVKSQHTVTADDGSFDFHPGRALNAGERVSWTFQKEGLFRYFCRIHGGRGGQGMAGVIRVGDPPRAPVPDVPVVVVPDDVPTLSDAATGAQPGTQVLVRPGVYREDVVVTVPRLDIRGLGTHPGEVILDGSDRRDVGVTVTAPGVRIANLTVTDYVRAGIQVNGGSGAAIEDTVLETNGLYGIEARAPAGMTVRGVRTGGHGIAGIGVRDCGACGTRIDDARIERNAAGIVARNATGVVIRGSQIRGNAVGVVFGDVAGSQVTANTLTGNSATDLWVASVFDDPEPPTGAGVWISGGSANLVAANTVTGHTYNVAVTGPAPAVEHRIADNTVGDARYADLGWDGLGAGVCFTRNRHPSRSDPTSDPPGAETLYACSAPTTAGSPIPSSPPTSSRTPGTPGTPSDPPPPREYFRLAQIWPYPSAPPRRCTKQQSLRGRDFPCPPGCSSSTT